MTNTDRELFRWRAAELEVLADKIEPLGALALCGLAAQYEALASRGVWAVPNMPKVERWGVLSR